MPDVVAHSYNPSYSEVSKHKALSPTTSITKNQKE
jgi:hypothetical protein